MWYANKLKYFHVLLICWCLLVGNDFLTSISFSFFFLLSFNLLHVLLLSLHLFATFGMRSFFFVILIFRWHSISQNEYACKNPMHVSTYCVQYDVWHTHVRCLRSKTNQLFTHPNEICVRIWLRDDRLVIIPIFVIAKDGN